MRGGAVNLVEMLMVLGVAAIVYLIGSIIVDKVYSVCVDIATQMNLGPDALNALDFIKACFGVGLIVVFAGIFIYGIVSSIKKETYIYDYVQ